MRAGEGIEHPGVSATTGAFALRGGIYAWSVAGTLGSVTLQILGPDGSSWANVGSAITAAPAFTSPLYLPPGSYRLALSGASGVYSSIARVPGE